MSVIAGLIVPAGLVAAQLAFGGCLGRAAFECQDDAQCDLGPSGRCFAGACAAEDDACESGYRYSEHSPDGAQCVPLDAASDDDDNDDDDDDSAPTTDDDDDDDDDDATTDDDDDDDDDDATTGGPAAGCAAQIDGARGHLCVRRQGGAVRCWGDASEQVASDEAVFDDGATAMSVGPNHACLLGPSGPPWCWGNDQQANFLGRGGFVFPPQQLADPDIPGSIAAVGAGHQTTCVAGPQDVYCRGAITAIRGLESGLLVHDGLEIIDMAVGRHHVCVLDDAGTVWCAGADDSWQLGDDDPMTSASFVEIDLDAPVVALDATINATCALDEEGTLWCWGRGASVVPGTSQNVTPVAVTGEIDLVAFGIGTQVVCGVGSDGLVYCFGTYFCGPEPSATYEPIGVLGRVAPGGDLEVAVGDDFMCIRAGTQDVACWGDDATVGAFPGVQRGGCAELRTIDPC